MLDFFSLLSIGLAFFAIAVSPGPANISNAAVAMSSGRKVSLIYGAGLSTGLVFWGVIAASGLGVILQGSVYLLMALKIIGGMYLVRLALLSGKKAVRSEVQWGEEISQCASSKEWFIRGILLNISNPKTVIAWMAALSVGLSPNDSLLVVTLSFLVCIVIGFATNAMYSLCFSCRGVMSCYRRAHQWINGAVSLLFAFAGFGLIRSAFYRGPVS